MKLTVDEKGRLAHAELFRPNSAFEASVQSDGSIRPIEIPPPDVPILKLRRLNGCLRSAPVSLNPETVAAAIRAERTLDEAR